MSAATPPPDPIQRELDDVIRLAERRLQRQSTSERLRRALRGASRNVLPTVAMPNPATLGGWAMAALLGSFLVSLVQPLSWLGFLMQVVGIALLVLAIVLSLLGGKTGSAWGRQEKVWRGERLSYENPYAGSDLFRRLRRLFRRQ